MIATLQTDLRQRGGMVSAWCSTASPFLAEAMAMADFPLITVDLQHGAQDFSDAVKVLQAIDGRGVHTLCRVHWNEPGIVMKVLDAGFGGVICPMINNRQEAEKLVECCFYPPHGMRSFGPIRAAITLEGDYVTRSRELVSVFPMIETMEGLQNLDEIVSVPGVSGVYVGPNDLALSLGYPAQLVPRAEVEKEILHILERVKAQNKLAGIACGSPEMTASMLKKGFDFATLLSDIRFFVYGMNTLLEETKALHQEDKP